MDNYKSILDINDLEVISSLKGKKFLITGADGMLGKAFQNQISNLVPLSKVFAMSRQQLDVRFISSFEKIFEIKPEFIIHCACLCNADRCESEKENARQIIVEGTKNIVEIAKKINSTVFFPQSFLIYGNENSFIDEFTIPRPMNIYGLLKYEAEQYLLENLQNSLSVRLGGFFGGESIDKNFVGKIIYFIRKNIKNKNSFIEIGNREWQPTFTNHIAANSLLLMANNLFGIYCMASHGKASFSEVAYEILKTLELTQKLKVKTIDSSFFAKKEVAKRPLNAIMSNSRLNNEKLDRQIYWKNSLNEYLSNYYFRKFFNE